MTTQQKQKFADILQALGNETTTQEHFEEMFSCLPPQLTNYTREKGFDAFLVGEPYTHKFCKTAGKIVPVFACYAKASDGTPMDIGCISEAAFDLFFNQK